MWSLRTGEIDMTKVRVDFERVHASGLSYSVVKINDEPLEFENDRAAEELEPGEAFEIYWRIQGNPGSNLTVKYKPEGGQEKTAVDKSAIPVGHSRYSDFKFIKL
jgi:hypothetical protein